jgi:hypothetical protein
MRIAAFYLIKRPSLALRQRLEKKRFGSDQRTAASPVPIAKPEAIRAPAGDSIIAAKGKALGARSLQKLPARRRCAHVVVMMMQFINRIIDRTRTEFMAGAWMLGASVLLLLPMLLLGSGVARADGLRSMPINAIARVKSAQIINVGTGDELRAALRDARPGDQIVIAAGVQLVGNFTLPNKPSGDSVNWITIRTAAPDEALPPADGRVTPAHSSVLAQLVSPNPDPALRAEAGAHHYRFVGVEFTIAPDVMLNFGIVRLGEGDESDAQLLPHDLMFDRCYVHGHARADVSRGFALNSASTDILNCHISDIHGLGFDTQAICGWNGPGPFRIINNYLEAAGENVLFGGADPKIADLSPSDIEFRRNDCTKPLAWKDGIVATPINVLATPLSGLGNNLPRGATLYYRVAARTRAGYAAVATSVASNEIALALAFDQGGVALVWDGVPIATEYRVYRTTDAPDAPARNWVSYTTTGASFTDVGDLLTAASDAPPEGATRWSVKNLFELKNARNVTVDGNRFENNWVDAQSGFAILFTVRNQDGKAPWSNVADIQFTNNVVRHAAAGINILGRDNNEPSQKAHDLLIRNNLFYDIGGDQWGGNGRFLQISEAAGVTLDRNTILHTGNIITAYGVPTSAFIFTNNLAPNNDFGVIGDGTASGRDTIDEYLPASIFKKNAIVGGQPARYPKKNLFPASFEEVGFADPGAGNFRLLPTSSLKSAGTNGRDIGADLDAIEQAHAGADESK